MEWINVEANWRVGSCYSPLWPGCQVELRSDLPYSLFAAGLARSGRPGAPAAAASVVVWGHSRLGSIRSMQGTRTAGLLDSRMGQEARVFPWNGRGSVSLWRRWAVALGALLQNSGDEALSFPSLPPKS